MKILSEEDGDTIMNDHFEDGEPMNTNIDNKLKETMIGFAQRYSQAQDFVKLGDKQAVNNLLTEATTAIQTAFKDEGYIQPHAQDWDVDTQSMVMRSFKEIGFMTGADWLERFTEELADWPITYANDGEKHLIERMLEYVNEAAKRASGIEEDNHGE